jgi:hypothetical protein
MILVRNQIIDMRGGKLHAEKFSINIGLTAIRIPVCVQYSYIGREE